MFMSICCKTIFNLKNNLNVQQENKLLSIQPTKYGVTVKMNELQLHVINMDQFQKTILNEEKQARHRRDYLHFHIISTKMYNTLYCLK